MRVLVCGGRDFKDRGCVFQYLDRAHQENYGGITEIITGCAKGADNLAMQWAASNGVECEVHTANWNKHGKAAGPIRNKRMAETKPDLVIAFPGGAGTSNMISLAISHGLTLWQIKEPK